jgi:DNA-directed RNA polymerase specialized sigma24 family protein
LRLALSQGASTLPLPSAGGHDHCHSLTEAAAVSDQSLVTYWIREAKAGEEAAAAALWQKYHAQLIGLARRRLAAVSRRVADEEDVVVDAFDSFWRGVQAGRFPKLEGRDDLWQILIMLTARKAANQRARLTRQKRGAGVVRGDSIWMPQDEAECQAFAEVAGSEPTPQFAAEVAEACGLLLDRLADETLRKVAVARMEGQSNEQIAQSLGVKVRTIERKLHLIRRIWAECEGTV